MIYDTAKELEKLGIDWTAGAQGIQMICKHYPNKCPFFAGSHKDTDLVEWPDFVQMSDYLISKVPMGYSFSFDGEKKEYVGMLHSVFDKVEINLDSVRSYDLRELAAKLILKVK